MDDHGEIKYQSRTVKDWIRRAVAGRIALADFQRSFVWTDEKCREYIEAVLNGYPVGLYLLLEVATAPQFDPRPFTGIDLDVGDAVAELVLDGQQRLTTLLHALHQSRKRRFFARFTTFGEGSASGAILDAIDVLKVGSSSEKAYRDPAVAYSDNLVPLDILSSQSHSTSLTRLQEWCARTTVGDSIATRILENRVGDYFNDHFFDRPLWYCRLPSSFDSKTATQVFIKTNTSSVRVSAFDIAVAEGRGEHEQNLRAMIRDGYDDLEYATLRNYFSNEAEKFIPQVGEWMLKVSCLHADKAPRQTNYLEAVKYLFEDHNNDTLGEHRVQLVLTDLKHALDFASERGAATLKTIASWPPLHVVAAVRRRGENLQDPVVANAVRTLLACFYWRSLFSDRYDTRANDKVLADYRHLVAQLERVENGRDVDLGPMWEQRHVPCSKEELLEDHWIGSTSRLGRAVASLVLSEGHPSDWVTGERLTATRLRKLEGDGRLDRHHIFPKKYLEEHGVKDRVDSALNGTFLDSRTNRRFSRQSPQEYIERMVGDPKFDGDVDEMKKRVESHLVPYETMVGTGDVQSQFDDFLRERASELFRRIQEVTKLE